MAQLKDLIVAGASRFIGDVYANKLQLTSLSAPTSAGGTTYGVGDNKYVLMSNGASIYWGTGVSSAIEALDVSTIGNTSGTKYIAAISQADGKISATAIDVATTYSASGTTAISGKGVAAAIGTLDVSAVGVAAATGNKFLCQISETDGKISATVATATIGSATQTLYVNAGTITVGFETFVLKTRSNIGTSPNFDDPGFSGLFEMRSSSETTGETGTKPFNGFAPFFTAKKEHVMLQLAGTNSNGFYIRGKQAAGVTLAGVDWERIVTNSGTWSISISGNATSATKANISTNTNGIAKYTDTAGTFGNIRTANGALYATSQDGAATFGTLPTGQGGTGNTSYTASRLVYSNTATKLASTSITSDGGYLGSVSYLSINNAHQTSYRLYVNGNSYLIGETVHGANIRSDTTRTDYLGTSSYYWKGAYIWGDGYIHWANMNTTTQPGGAVINKWNESNGLTGILKEDVRNNKLFGVIPEAITIEETNDGTTWTTRTVSDRNKQKWFNLELPHDNTCCVGSGITMDVGSGNTHSDLTVGMGIRVTVDLKKEHRTTAWISQFVTLIYTRGQTCKLTIEKHNKASDAWTTIAEWTGAGDDWLNTYQAGDVELYGNSSATTVRRANQLRWTLVITALGTANRYAPTLRGMMAYGRYGVGMNINASYPSSRFSWCMANYGTPYYIEDRNVRAPIVTFDANIYPRQHATITAAESIDNIHNIGASDRRWANIYAVNFHGAFIGSGSELTNLNASNLASGTIANARLPVRLQEYHTSASNDSTACGWYYGTSNSPFLKYHTSNADFMVWTNGYSTAWASEIATDFRSNRIAIRNLNNGTWNSWNELASNDSIANEFVWTSDIYYDAVNNRFTNTRATNAWTSQIYSKHGFVDGCYVSFRLEDTTHYRMIGLNSDPTNNTSYNTIDYCWYPQNGGSLSIYENGSSISSISGHTTYAAGDDFRIEYSNGQVRYYHNGIVCRTVDRAIDSQLYLDSSLYNGGTIVDLRFGPITNNINISGNATTATTLQTARTIWGQSFNGSANISGNMTGVGPAMYLPANQSNFQFLTSGGGAGNGQFGKIGLNSSYADINFTNYVLDVKGNSRFRGTIYINDTTDAAGTNASGALIIGTTTGENIAIDSNEVMARNNSAVSTLYLNNDGGVVQIGKANTTSAGGLNLYSYKNDASIFITDYYATTSNSWNAGVGHLAPNIVAGSNTSIYTGVALSNYNIGVLQYHYTEAGSTSNYVGLGLYGKDYIIRCYGTGNVAIGADNNNYKLYVSGTSYFDDNITSNKSIYFGGNTSSGKAILAYNATYPNYGIWYFDESADSMTFSANNQANSKTGAELLINGGNLYNQNRRIPHTNNTTGSVGGTTQPVYVNAGAITAITYTANRLYYSANTSSFAATSHYASTTKISINSTSEPSHNLYVNGTSCLNGQLSVNGDIYIYKSGASLSIEDLIMDRTGIGVENEDYYIDWSNLGSVLKLYTRIAVSSSNYGATAPSGNPGTGTGTVYFQIV